MYLVKEGYPEEGEIVYCEVSKITRGMVFVRLVEYKKEAILPVPEISPGRIRNLRDYVKVGKKIVCLVLSVNQKNDHIVVSLRRVSESARRAKLDQIRQELNAEGLIDYVAKILKKEPKKLYTEIHNKIKDEYTTMYDFFVHVVENKINLNKYIKDKKLAEILHSAIVDRIKPKSVMKKARISLKVYSGNGLLKIKKAFNEVLNLDKKRYNYESLTAKYLGGGNYEITAVTKEFDDVNKVIDDSIKILEKHFEDKSNVEFEYKVFKGEKLS